MVKTCAGRYSPYIDFDGQSFCENKETAFLFYKDCIEQLAKLNLNNHRLGCRKAENIPMNLMSLIRSKEVRYLTVCKCPSFKIRKEGIFLIILNGEETADMAGKTLADLLQEKTDMMQNVVVELNGKIMHREELANQTLSENDHVELISFVGGG